MSRDCVVLMVVQSAQGPAGADGLQGKGIEGTVVAAGSAGQVAYTYVPEALYGGLCLDEGSGKVCLPSRDVLPLVSGRCQ